MPKTKNTTNSTDKSKYAYDNPAYIYDKKNDPKGSADPKLEGWESVSSTHAKPIFKGGPTNYPSSSKK